MDSDSPVLFSYEIMGDGTGVELVENQVIVDKIKDKALAWVHLDATHENVRSWLQETVPYLDSLILDALLANETRPRITLHDEGALMILRGVNLNEGADPEDMISVRLWVDDKRIITMRRRPLKAIQDIRGRLEDGKGPKGAGALVADLASRLFERMEPVFSELDDLLDVCEEKILEKADISERQKITEIRQEAILYRRYIAPQKDVIASLRLSEYEWLDAMDKRKLFESLDRVTRYIEDLDAIRERAFIIKDELASSLADKMNNNMYVLSIVAAVFLPLGFLTGLLGINVGGMPGADNEMAFWFVCGLCAFCMILILAVFRTLKWI